MLEQDTTGRNMGGGQENINDNLRQSEVEKLSLGSFRALLSAMGSLWLFWFFFVLFFE